MADIPMFNTPEQRLDWIFVSTLQNKETLEEMHKTMSAQFKEIHEILDRHDSAIEECNRKEDGNRKLSMQQHKEIMSVLQPRSQEFKETITARTKAEEFKAQKEVIIMSQPWYREALRNPAVLIGIILGLFSISDRLVSMFQWAVQHASK